MITGRINHYSFINEEGAMVDPANQKKGRGSYFLYGKFTDSWTFFMGVPENCKTAAVTAITDAKSVVTRDGSIYSLGTIAPEYKEFLEATKKGVLVVGNWNILGTRKRGYCLTGDTFPERKAISTARILYQEGNMLTIRRLITTPSGERIWNDPEHVFVCWNSMSHHAVTEIRRLGKVADIEYRDFERFAGLRCKPVLFEKT